MEERRISASPRSCSVQQVVVNKKWPRPAEGFLNSGKKLQRWEICSKRDWAFSMSNTPASRSVRSSSMSVTGGKHQKREIEEALYFLSPVVEAAKEMSCWHQYHQECLEGIVGRKRQRG